MKDRKEITGRQEILDVALADQAAILAPFIGKVAGAAQQLREAHVQNVGEFRHINTGVPDLALQPMLPIFDVES